MKLDFEKNENYLDKGDDDCGDSEGEVLIFEEFFEFWNTWVFMEALVRWSTLLDLPFAARDRERLAGIV